MSKSKYSPVEYKDNTLKAKIEAAFLQGKRPSEIAKEQDCSIQHVNNVLREVTEIISFEMMDLAEQIHLRNLARLEQLHSAVWPYALGMPLLGEDGEPIDGTAIPDKGYVKLVLDILKQQTEWVAAVRLQQEKAAKEMSAEDTIVAQGTFSRNSPLYHQAQESMEEDWLGYKDVPLESIYGTDPDGPVAKKIAQLEEAIKGAGIAVDEDDEDGE